MKHTDAAITRISVFQRPHSKQNPLNNHMQFTGVRHKKREIRVSTQMLKTNRYPRSKNRRKKL